MGEVVNLRIQYGEPRVWAFYFTPLGVVQILLMISSFAVGMNYNPPLYLSKNKFIWIEIKARNAFSNMS